MSETTSDRDVFTVDQNGNPLCRGCYADSFTMAGRSNAGLRPCFCPPEDKRVATPWSLADARERIRFALDGIEALGHRTTCTCPVCDAYQVLRFGTGEWL